MLSPSNVYRLAHAGPRGMLVLSVLYPLAVVGTSVPHLAVVCVIVLAGVVATQFTLLYAAWAHRRILCPTCATTTPLDCQAEATRQDRTLRRHHSPTLALTLTAMSAMPAVALVFGLPFVLGQLALSAALAIVARLMQAWNVHLLLQPWCPYCRRYRRWEDGGPREPTPTPAPPTRIDA